MSEAVPRSDPEQSSQALRRGLMVRVAVATAALLAIAVLALAVLVPKSTTEAIRSPAAASVVPAAIPTGARSSSLDAGTPTKADSAAAEESGSSAGAAAASAEEPAAIAAASVHRQQAPGAGTGANPGAAMAVEASAAGQPNEPQNNPSTAVLEPQSDAADSKNESPAAAASGGPAAVNRAPTEAMQGERGATKSASAGRAAGSKPARGPHLQAGVFLQPDNAQALKATLEAQGVPVYIESRVHIGPFRNRKEAERMREKLKELGHSTVLVMQ